MVEAKGLCMNYGTTRALIDASFIAADNQVMGLLGPNGAGKTTCMKIIATQMVPTSGTALVAGLDVLNDPIEVRRRVGYLPETAPLYADMEVAEYLDFVGRGRGLENSNLKNRIDWVVNACRVKDVYRKPVGDLSRGYRQRVGLAQALKNLFRLRNYFKPGGHENSGNDAQILIHKSSTPMDFFETGKVGRILDD